MIPEKDLRKIEVLQGSDWVEIKSMGQLEEGDVFRMFEPDGEPVLNNEGGICYIVQEQSAVLCDSYKMVN